MTPPDMQEDPARLPPEERLAEIADILARAVIRLQQRKLRKNSHIQLDSSPISSVYGRAKGGENL